MIAGLENVFIKMAETVGLFLFIFDASSFVEWRHPIEPGQSKSEIFLDYKLAFANIILGIVFAPLSGWIIAMVVTSAGGGLITLRADGWWYPVSLAVTVLAVELLGYW